MRKKSSADLTKTNIDLTLSGIKARPRHPHLVIFIGVDSGKRFELQPGNTTIGRDPDADITIDDEWASRIHAVIDWTDDVIRIMDNGSTNGVYVDFRRADSAILAQGVPVQIGHSVMKIDFKDEAEIRLENDLWHNACIDGLTGISNRQHFL